MTITELSETLAHIASLRSQGDDDTTRHELAGKSWTPYACRREVCRGSDSASRGARC